MKQPKSPAFLFYTNDFTSGTMFFTDEQVGIYIRLLCAMHQHSRLNEKQVLHICKTLDKDILAKFKIDAAGLYYNERLEEEIQKRNSFSQSRSLNRKGKTTTSEEHILNTSDAGVKLMDNDNDNEKEDVKEEGLVAAISKNHTLHKFIKTLSQVSKMKTQPTSEECDKLIVVFGQSVVETVLLQMENKPNILKKYTSVYATALNWCKNYKAPAGSLAAPTASQLATNGFGKLQ
jgi:uncharacterized protein YdaU (DUF1376 family)